MTDASWARLTTLTSFLRLLTSWWDFMKTDCSARGYRYNEACSVDTTLLFGFPLLPSRYRAMPDTNLWVGWLRPRPAKLRVRIMWASIEWHTRYRNTKIQKITHTQGVITHLAHGLYQLMLCCMSHCLGGCLYSSDQGVMAVTSTQHWTALGGARDGQARETRRLLQCLQ